MSKSNYYSIGYVARVSGNKGELVLLLDVDDAARYNRLDAVFLDVQGTLTPFFITSCRLYQNQITIGVEGVSTNEEARELQGSEAWLPLAALPPLDETRFYFHEVPGFVVIDEVHGEIGTVHEAIERSVQPILNVHQGKTEILIPLAPGVLKKVDRANKTIQVHAPDGLIELYLNAGNEKPDDGDEE
jgi:16S rRNA processing protein RimM